jgi:rubrerythrin
MTKSLKGTETHLNLMKAFAGESQARNRYTFYGLVAQNQGYPLIKKTLDFTADQEEMHAKIFFQFLSEEFNGKAIEIEASYPVDLYDEQTLENLLAAVAGETHEHEEVYPAFAKKAKEEGFPKIAAAFENIGKVEAQHAKVFQEIAKELKEGTLFKKEKSTVWHCTVCGFMHEGKTAPTICPVCSHPKGHFNPEK